MGRIEDFIKKSNSKNRVSDQNAESYGRGNETFEERWSRIGKSSIVYDVDDDYMTSFQNNYKSYMDKVQSTGESDNDEWNSLNQQQRYLKAYLNSKASSMEKSEYEDFNNYLNSIDSSSRSAENYATKLAKQKRDYQEYYDANKDYIEYNLESGKAEIDRLQNAFNEYSNLEKLMPYGDARLSSDGDDYATDILNKQSKVLSDAGFSSYKELQNALASENLLYSRSEQFQNSEKLLNDAYSDPDFSKVAEKGKELIDYSSLANQSVFGGKSYAALSKDEANYYAYYLAKEKDGSVAPGTAQSFLDSIDDTLNQRAATKKFEELEDNFGYEMLFGVSAGLNQFKRGMESLGKATTDFITGNDSVDYGYAPTVNEYVSSAVREDLSDVGFRSELFNISLGQGAYDLVTTTSNMLPSIAASTAVGILNPEAGEIVGSALLGASAAGNAYQEMLSLGYTKGQARVYGILTGLSEAGLQYALGGVAKLGGKITNQSIKSIAEGINNALVKASVEFGLDMASEGLEEFLQDVLDPYFKAVATMDTPEAVDWGQALYSGILGAISAGVLNGAGKITENAQTTKSAFDTKKNGRVDSLVEAGKTFDISSVAYQLADKVDEKTGVLELAKLIKEINANIGDQTKADIQFELMKKGVMRTDAEIISDWLSEVALGKNLTKEQQLALENNPVIARVFRKVIMDKNSSVNQRFQAINDSRGGDGVYGVDFTGVKELGTNKTLSNSVNTINSYKNSFQEFRNRVYGLGENNSDRYNESMGKKVDAALDDFAKNAYTRANKADRTKVAEDRAIEKVSEDHTMSANGSQINPETTQIVSKDKGTLTLKTEDGTEISSEELSYASKKQALVYELVALSDIDVKTANEVVDMARNVSDVTSFVLGFEEAYDYGKSGTPLDKINIKGYMGNLDQDQIAYAYKQGQIEAILNFKKDQKKVDSKVTNKKLNSGKVTILFGDRNNLTFTPRQETSLKYIDNVVGKISHNEVRVFNTVKKGKDMVFAHDVVTSTKTYKAGTKAPNGFFDSNTGIIYLDINAGIHGEGVLLWTFAHEMTHFIREYSPEKYNKLAYYLVNEYGQMELDINYYIERQIEKAKKNDRDITRDEALEEVIADTLQKMFTDTNVNDKLATLKKTDKKLYNLIKDLINKFIAKIRSVYKELPAQSEEALVLDKFAYKMEQIAKGKKLPNNMVPKIDVVSDLFFDAMADAGKAYQHMEVLDSIIEDVTPEIGEETTVEDMTKNSYRSFAEACGFEAIEDHETEMRYWLFNGQKVSKVTEENIIDSPIGALISYSMDQNYITEADYKKQIKMFTEIANMCVTQGDFAQAMQFVGSAIFTGMKANADKQYGTTYDFPSICTKTQAIVDKMSSEMVRLGRGLTKSEIETLYRKVWEMGNPVPCPECYVFSRWVGIGGLLDNIKKYQDKYSEMTVAEVEKSYQEMKAQIEKYAKDNQLSFGKAKGKLASKFTKEYNSLSDEIRKAQEKGEKVNEKKAQKLLKLESQMDTVKAMTWIDTVYFKDSAHKTVNKKYYVPTNVLFNLNMGEEFATKYKEAWAFRTTQGAGYGKAITPYAEAVLGEGILVTNNTTKAIKDKQNRTNIDQRKSNVFLEQKGTLNKEARTKLETARKKQLTQAFIGGQRFQSTSDARYENFLDYLIAAVELQAMHGMAQVYTKVSGAVPAFNNWGMSINQSLMPLNNGFDEYGRLSDTSTGGMKPEVAFKNRELYESAGTITIGVNDNHIRALISMINRDFVIPYHASGGDRVLINEFRRIQDSSIKDNSNQYSTDYSKVQGEKLLAYDLLLRIGYSESQVKDVSKFREQRLAILTGKGKIDTDYINKKGNEILKKMYDEIRTKGGKWYGISLTKGKCESQIYPNEYWDTSVTYDESEKITKDYLEYCRRLGILPKFSGQTVKYNKSLGYSELVPVTGYDENGNKVNLTNLAYIGGDVKNGVEPFFWKTLTDRRMYGNDGQYLDQKFVTLGDADPSVAITFAKVNEGSSREYNKEISDKTVAEDTLVSKENKLSGRGNDYDGYSMSNNAREAYLNDEKPLSKWSKSEIVEMVSEINPDIDLSKTNLATLKNNLLTKTSWHHTSKYYNRTDFYSLNEDYIKNLTQKDVDEFVKVEETKTQRNKTFDEKIDDVYFKAQAIVNSGMLKKESTAINRFLKGMDFEDAYNKARDIIKARDAQKIEQWKKLPSDHYRHQDVALYESDIDQYIKKMYADKTLSRNSNIFKSISEKLGESDTKYSDREESLTTYIKDGYNTTTGETVNFVDLILDGKKKGETRDHKSLTRKWVGIAKDGYVYGKVKLGDPKKITKDSPEYKDAYIEGTNYDIGEKGYKYYYPILEKEDFRDNPRPITQNGNYGKYMYSDRTENILMGSLFSGGGLLEKGLTYQLVDKEFAVEYDGKIAELYSANNGKEHLYVGDVRKFNSKSKQNVFYLHASPSCKAYSKANTKGGESDIDITTAKATAKVLNEQRPVVFTMENVPEYKGSTAYNYIASMLDKLGYNWDVDVYNAADYGNPSNRRRLIIRAVQKGMELPSKPTKMDQRVSWGETTQDIWDTELTESYLVPSMERAIENTPEFKGKNILDTEKPILIMDTNSGKTVNYAYADEVAPTVTTKCGDSRVIMNGKVYRPTPKFISRLMGFTDENPYTFDGKRNLTTRYTVMGNGIPVNLTRAVMGSTLESAYSQNNNGNTLYSGRDELAPVFYSQMSKVIDNIKPGKMGANGVVSYLKGKGIKNEEIKWSGIQTFLEGKKSVTKEELQEFAKANMLQIEEVTLGGTTEYEYEDFIKNLKQYYDFSVGDEDFFFDYDGDFYFNSFANYVDDLYEDGEIDEDQHDSMMMVGAEFDTNYSADTKWGRYVTDGASNYREILFKIPGSEYSNKAMETHWDQKGVLAHARVDDQILSDGSRMLFIEEIQSDWHNAGHKKGYIKKGEKQQRDKAFYKDRIERVTRSFINSEEIQNGIASKLKKNGYSTNQIEMYLNYLIDTNDNMRNMTIAGLEKNGIKLSQYELSLISDYVQELSMWYKKWEEAPTYSPKVPDAPFKNYTDFVMKRLLRMAAEENYDYIGWTTGQMQEDRWSSEYSEGYRIEYDQDIPKFMNKYGKQWGVEVSYDLLDETNDKVHSVPINLAMKESVLYEGQPMYSDRDDNALDTRTILANALESTAQSSTEKELLARYKDKVKNINSMQNKFTSNNMLISELYKEGKATEAKALAEKNKVLGYRINNWDKELLKLESMKPLKDVVNRERKQAWKDAYAKVQEQTKDKYEKRIQNMRDRREATEYRGKLRNMLEDTRKMLDSNARGAKAPAALVGFMVDVYNIINPTGNNQDTNSAQRYYYTRDALNELKMKYDTLNESEDYAYKSEWDDVMSEKIKKLSDAVGDTPLRDMTKDQLSDVYDIMSDILATVRNANKLIGNNEMTDAYETADKIILEQDNIKRKKLNKIVNNSKLNFLNDISDGFRRMTLNPMRTVREMSGFNDDSYLVKLFNDLNDGLTLKNQFDMENRKRFDALRDTKENEKIFNDAVEKKIDIGIKDVDGEPALLTKMQIMQALLTIKRENANQGRMHLATPVRFADNDYLLKGDKTKAKDKAYIVMVDDTFERLANEALTEWDKQYMQVAYDFFNKYAKEAIDKVSLATKYRLTATENAYIPYTVDDDFIAKDSEFLKYDATLGGMGMLKSMKQNSTKPLFMWGLNSVIDRHINDVGKVYGLTIPVRNWNKVFNVSNNDLNISVKETLGRTWSKKDVDILDQAVSELQSPRPGKRNELLAKMKSAFVASTLAGNVSVWLKQFSSYPTAGAILSRKALTSGTYRYTMRKNSEIWAEIDEHTPQHYLRRKGLSLQELGEIAQSKGWENKINKKLGKLSPMNWIQAMDVMTTSMLWEASKADVESKMSTSDPNYWNEVTKLYEKVLAETQPMYDVLHRAEVTKDLFWSNIIMFQTQPLQNSGILRESTYKYKMALKEYGKGSEQAKSAAKGFQKAVVSQLASHLTFTLFTLIANMVLHKMNPWRDDDEDITAESVSGEFISSTLENYFSAAVPVVGSYAISAFDKLFNGSRYDVLSDPIVDKINTTFNNFGKLKDPSLDNFLTMATDIASYYGIPASNLVNFGKSVKLYAEDISNGELGSFEAGVDRTNKQEVSRMYKAYNSGDTKKVTTIMTEMKEEYVAKGKTEKEATTQIKSSVTNYLKDTFLEAYKANNSAKMAEIRKFMSATKLYDNVVETTQDWIKNSKKNK